MEVFILKENIKLIKPNLSLKNEYLNMILEWKEYGGDIVPWSLNFDTNDYDTLVDELNGYSLGLGLPDGFVPCSTYWLINNENKLLGAIEIRHQLNDNLKFRGGHIGYGIRPSERRKGYASNMLSLALKQCKSMGLSKVLITCSKDNFGSAKTIINNGGVLDSEDIDNSEVFQRYWITLD